MAVDVFEIVLVQVVGQIVAGVVNSALAPELAAVQALAWTLEPGLPLTPQEAAVAVVKGHLDHKAALIDALKSGTSEQRLKIMEQAAGNPPPADFLLQLARRGIIPIADDKGAESVSAEQGIRESLLHNKWLGVLEQGQWGLPSLGAVIESRLRSYIDDKDYNIWTHRLGLKDEEAHFELRAAGIPISPQEGYQAFHRGLIPLKGTGEDAVTLETIFKESRIIDKYLDVWLALQEYLPPPRTITALLRAGSITEAKARDLFKKSGLPDELVDAYVADASHQKTQATKELAVNTVVGMYKAKELSREQALGFIEGRGYTAEDAAFLLDFADFQLVEAQVAALVSRLRTLYVGHKIPKQTAVDALGNVGMAPEVVANVLAVWDQEANASPVLLTAVQIADAAAQKRLDPNTALDELQGRGYDLRDAYLVLALHKVDLSSVPTPPGVLSPP